MGLEGWGGKLGLIFLEYRRPSRNAPPTPPLLDPMHFQCTANAMSKGAPPRTGSVSFMLNVPLPDSDSRLGTSLVREPSM